MNRYQEISRSLVKKRLREKLEQQRIDKQIRRNPARHDRDPVPVPMPKLH